MLVVQEPLSACEISLEIEVETDKVAKAVDQVYREYSEHITVPGFRKGKAPLSFVKQRVPDAKLRERAAELLVEPAYREALEQESISPFAAPKLELINLETQAPHTFKFKAVVPLAPKIELGKYVGVEVEKLKTEITAANVETRLSALQERAAEFPTITDRPSQIGDVLAVEIAISPEEGEPGAARNTVVRIGDPDNVPGLSEELVGLKAGEHKHFTLTYPETYSVSELAGKPAEFHVLVMEVHDRILPELTDEFAQKFGKVDTLDEMRQNLRKELETIAENNANDAAETLLIDKIVASSTIDYPTVLIDEEVNDEIQALLADLKRRQIEVDDYLNQIGQTPEDLTKTISTRADVRIRRGLVLGDVAKRENLLLTEDDVDKEVAERAEQQGTSPESMRAYLDANKQIDNVRNVAQTKKVLGFLSGSAIITVKSPSEMSSSKPTQTAKKTSKPKNTEEVAMKAEAPAKPRARKKKVEEPVAE
jgi:trigger factor